MVFNLLIDFRAYQDIDDAIEYYMSKNPSVARKFYGNIQHCYAALGQNPFFEIRHHQYRCLPIKDFPYMIHFSVDDENGIVQIHALINTYKGPDDNWLKQDL